MYYTETMAWARGCGRRAWSKTPDGGVREADTFSGPELPGDVVLGAACLGRDRAESATGLRDNTLRARDNRRRVPSACGSFENVVSQN